MQQNLTNIEFTNEHMFDKRTRKIEGGGFLKVKNNALETEVAVSELRQQLSYSRTVCGDIFKIFSADEPDSEQLVTEYHAIRNRLSMMLDFLFQANLWCNSLDKHISKEDK